MKDIFTNLYNKVIGFFQSDKGDSSKVIASNRLKLVLMHDRTNLDTLTMQKMREQLIKVISRYIEIDQEALDLNLEGEGDAIALMLNIPVIRARTLEEIEAIEKAEEEELAQKAAKDSSEDESDEEEADDSESEDNDEDAAEDSEESEYEEETPEVENSDSEENSESEQASVSGKQKAKKK